MSQVLNYFRSQDDRLKTVPDEDLALFIAETHPEFLQDEEFGGQVAKLTEPRPSEPSTRPLSPKSKSMVDRDTDAAAARWGYGDAKPKLATEEANALTQWYDSAKQLAGENIELVKRLEEQRQAQLRELGVEPLRDVDNPLKTVAKPVGQAIEGGAKVAKAAVGDVASLVAGVPAENLSTFANDPKGPLPIEEQVAQAEGWWRRAAGYIGLAGAAAPVYLGGAAGMGAMGIPPATANAVMMGVDPEGRPDPIGIAAAFGLPIVDKAGRQLTAKALEKVFDRVKVVRQELADEPGKIVAQIKNQGLLQALKHDEILKAVEIGGGQLADNAYLLALQTPGILTAENPKEALLQAVAGNVAMALMGAPELKGGGKSITYETLRQRFAKGTWPEGRVERRPEPKPEARAIPPPEPAPPPPEAPVAPPPRPTPPPPPTPEPAPPPAPEPVKPVETPASRQDPADPAVILGRPTTVRGANETQFPAMYAWVPAERIEGSHGLGFAPNPNYAPLENTRRYESDPAEQEKVVRGATTFDPASYATNARTAADGPIMVSRGQDGRYRVLGGNGRWQMIQSLTAPQAVEFGRVQDEEAPSFGLPVRPGPNAVLVRLLPPIDLADPQGLEGAKRVVDLLNPSPGLVETAASMARNDAAKVSFDGLRRLPGNPSAARAREWMTAEMTAGALDRNTRRQILDTDSQLLDYVARVRLHRAYLDDSVVESARSPKSSESLKAMIEAPVPAMLALRDTGEIKLPTALAEMVRRVAGYIGEGQKLDGALKQVSDQVEMFAGPEFELARSLAGALSTQIELLEPNKRGVRKIDFEATRDNFETFFERLASSIRTANTEPDLLGATRTPAVAVQEFLRMQIGDAPALQMDGDGSYRSEPNPDVRALNRLAEVARRRKLSPKESASMARLEARLGNDFMRFWSEQRGRIDQYDADARSSPQTKQATSPPGTTYEIQFGPNERRPGSPPVVYASLGHMDKVRPAEMPELVALAKSLLGHVPLVRRLPKARGVFVPAPAGATIKMSPDVFRDPIQAAKTLAHEIGHLIDWLPDRSLARGNLFGRVGSLLGWLKTTFPLKQSTPIEAVLTPKDRSRIRALAEKKVGPRPPRDEEADLAAWKALVSEAYTELLDEEIESRGLAKLDVVRDELWTLSTEWRPLPAGEIPQSYLEYRMSGQELYADALSVLLNSPGFLEETAPVFYQMFWEYLDQKPEVQQELLDLQSFLARGKIPTLAQRQSDVNQMFRSGEEKMRQAAEQRELRRNSWKGWWAQLANDLVDRNYAARAKAQEAGDSRTVQVLDELGLRDNINMMLIRRVFETVLKPAEDAGFTIDQLGEVLFLERIMAGDRNVLANPLGHTPLTARQQLWRLRNQIGLEQWTNLKSWVQRFHDITFSVVESAVEAGVYNRETFETVIRPNKDSYAAFAVVEYLEDFVPPSIRQQMGTFKDIANPLTATLYKTVALNNLIAWNKAKTTVRDMLLTRFPEEIKPADVAGLPTAPRARSHPDFGALSPLVDGRPEHWYVDPYIAQAFEEVPPMHLSSVVRVLDTAFRKVLYPLIITYNPGFLFLTSPIREVRRTGRNLPVHFGRVKLLREYARVWSDVVKRFSGEATPLTRELEGTLALATPFDTVAGIHRDDAIGRLMERYELATPANRKSIFDREIFRPIKRLAKGIEFWGMVVDSLPKYGAYNILRRELKYSPKEAAGWVRTYAGLPNIKNKGRSQGLVRAVAPFWNVFTQGWRADSRLMRSPKTRGGYWLRWMLSEGWWTILQALGAAGLLGAGLKALYDGISEYKKTNYTVLPIGTIAGGDFGSKTVYLQLPRDETDRVLSGMLYKLITSLGGGKDQTSLAQDLSDLMAFGSGQVPGANPVMTIADKWLDYARNLPPIDPLTGRPIIPTKQWDAGGVYSLAPMASWTLAQGRLNVFGYDPKQDRTFEMVMNGLPVAGRFMQISDYGHRERQRGREQAGAKRDERRRLSYSPEVQRLVGEYNGIRGLDAANRTEPQQRRLIEVGAWYNSTYRMYDEAVEHAQDQRDGSTAESLRRQLHDSAQALQRSP